MPQSPRPTDPRINRYNSPSPTPEQSHRDPPPRQITTSHRNQTDTTYQNREPPLPRQPPRQHLPEKQLWRSRKHLHNLSDQSQSADRPTVVAPEPAILSSEEKLILSKGLSFVPTKTVKNEQFHTDLDTFQTQLPQRATPYQFDIPNHPLIPNKDIHILLLQIKAQTPSNNIFRTVKHLYLIVLARQSIEIT